MGNKLPGGSYKIDSQYIKSISYMSNDKCQHTIFFAAPIMDIDIGHLVIITSGKHIDYLFVNNIRKETIDTGLCILTFELVRKMDGPIVNYVVLRLTKNVLHGIFCADNIATKIIDVGYD